MVRLALAKAERKVRGGKFIRVAIEVEEGLISSMLITGDFFLYPEESIQDIERAVVGIPLNCMERIAAEISRTIEKDNCQLVGFSIEDLIDLIGECGRCGD